MMHRATPFAAVIAMLLAPIGAYGQLTGTIEGAVTDPSGRVVPDVSLRAVEVSTNAERLLSTDREGRYVAAELAPGRYRLMVKSEGFDPEETEPLELTAGRTVRVDIALHLSAAKESVRVSAQLKPVDVDATAWGSSIEERQLASLPLNGRDMFDLAAQQPGVTAPASATRVIDAGLGVHISVNGNRPSENAFRLDGIYINEATGSAPASAAGNLLGLDTIAELRLVTSPFSAEYGRTDGGVLTAVSKSGTNEFHGSAWEYLRNSAMDAKNFFDPAGPIPALRLNQFGALVGGPLVRNRLFFLGDYEGIRSETNDTETLSTPNADARTGLIPVNGVMKQVTVSPAIVPYLSLYPLPNGPDLGNGTGEYIAGQPSDTDEDYAVGKVDFVASPKLRLGARYSGDTASIHTLDAFRFWNFENLSHYNLWQATAQYVQSPSVIHDFRAAFSQIYNGTAATVPDSSSSLAFVPGGRIGSIQVVGLSDFGGDAARTAPRHFNTVDAQTSYSLAWLRGRHSFSFGASYDRILLGESGDLDRNGYYQFTSLQNFLTASPNRLSILQPGSGSLRHFSLNQFSWFAQDNIRLTARLTAGIGVRYETATTPVERDGRVASLPHPYTDTQVTVGGPMWINPSTLNFAPRASLAWDVSGDGRTVVRAGSGIFYDLLGTRELTVSALFMPPFYQRYNISKAPFPNALAALQNATVKPSIDGLSYWPKQPYVLQYQLMVERALGWGILAEVGYAGSRGVHLDGDVNNINTTKPQFLSDGRTYFQSNLGPINPAFGSIGMRITDFDSNYNGLIAGARFALPHGLHVQTKFGWAKSIDDDSVAIHAESYNNNKVPTMFNYAQNRGPSDFDCRLTFAANLTWQIPGVRSRGANTILGGWELDGLAQAQSGNPFNPVVGFDNAHLLGSGDQGQRPNLVAGVQAISGDPSQYFNSLAFSLPASGYYGNLGRNVFTGPGLAIVSLALQRDFLRSERRSLRIRVEAFNVANHPNFQIPSGDALFDSTGSRLGTAGQITDTTTTPRKLQLSARFSF